jgi:23S rRNA pseudouridine2605 synthase
LCSRSEAYGLIRSGRVTVDGFIVKDPNSVISVAANIYINGYKVKAKHKRYIIFNKPAGCVTTRKDEKNRKTVYDVLGDIGGRLFSVGRLDKETEGLLIFTNDTEFGNYLTDPRNKIPRTYIITVDGIFAEKDIAKMVAGVDIGRGEFSRPVSAKIVKRPDAAVTVLEITLIEGKNREIRRLCEALDAPVKKLVRVSFGPFRLGNLPSGGWRELDAKICGEIARPR